jgi:hypothetical protein
MMDLIHIEVNPVATFIVTVGIVEDVIQVGLVAL